MAWIDMIAEDKAEGKLAKLYDKLTGPKNKKVAHVLKVHSLNPDVFEDHLNLYKTIMYGKSNITRKQREMVATFVSNLNECHYWINHHGAALQKLIRDNEKADKIFSEVIADYNTADISKKERAMLCYAEKLTKKPKSVKKEDIKNLKEMGLSDKDILDLNQVVSYFNYVNRIAEGLGIELEEEREEIYKK